ncbi:MAG: endoglycosidase [Bacteroidales bacterium]|nr:endoglycosidase [Bacteroidales bacterium]
MKRNKILIYTFFLLLGGAFNFCSNDIENIGFQIPPKVVDYEALRAYKASDHQILFGWFGGWDGGNSASSVTMLMALPDSVDLVSIWGSNLKLTEKQKQDMHDVQTIKGTKVMATIFMPYIGRYITPESEDPKEYWGWDDTDYDIQVQSIQKYAKALADTIIKLGYDGMDIDNEGEGGNSFYGNPKYVTPFLTELGKYLGPESKSGKLLCIDGYLTVGIEEDMYPYIDYFICQAYYATSYFSLESGGNRFDTYAAHFAKHGSREELAKKYITTEDYERYAGSGGPEFRTRSGEIVRGVVGHAGWNPIGSTMGEETPKGGAGLYHIEYDYSDDKGVYYWVNQMIQTMNPAQPVSVLK